MPELSPKLARMVEASRQVQAPSVDERERISRALGRRLAVGAVVAATALGTREVAGASAAAAKAGFLGGSAATVKWAVASLAVVAGGLGGVGVYRAKTRVEPAPVVASVVPVRVAARRPAEPRIVRTAPEQAPAASETTAPSIPAAPVHAAAPSATRPSDTLGRELELLRAAQRALDSGAPAQALGLLNEYAAEFPRGALRHESQAARIIALCAAGQRAAGLKAAEQFLQAEPNSPFARRVRTACGAPAD